MPGVREDPVVLQGDENVDRGHYKFILLSKVGQQEARNQEWKKMIQNIVGCYIGRDQANKGVASMSKFPSIDRDSGVASIYPGRDRE